VAIIIMGIIEAGLPKVGLNDDSGIVNLVVKKSSKDEKIFPLYCGKIKIKDLKLINGKLTNDVDLKDRLVKLGLVSDDYVILPDSFIAFDVDGLKDTKFFIRYFTAEKDSASRIIKFYNGKSLSELVFKGGKKLKYVECNVYLFAPSENYLFSETHYFHFKK